jgi:hypothetical protein
VLYLQRTGLLPAGVSLMITAGDQKNMLNSHMCRHMCHLVRDNLFNVTCMVSIGDIEDTSQPAPCTATASAAPAPTLTPAQTPALLALKL